jgi:hypothetical protein
MLLTISAGDSIGHSGFFRCWHSLEGFLVAGRIFGIDDAPITGRMAVKAVRKMIGGAAVSLSDDPQRIVAMSFAWLGWVDLLVQECRWASVGAGWFIIRSIAGPPVLLKRHTNTAAKPRNTILSQVV